MNDNVQEIIDKQSCSLKVDESLLSSAGDDEDVLCLNYDGLYGINNINRFLHKVIRIRLLNGTFSNTKLGSLSCSWRTTASILSSTTI